MDASFNDRRSEPRHESEWPVYLRSGKNKEQIGDVADISLSGLKIILYDAVEFGAEPESYDLYLCRVQNPMDLMNITGRIVWSVRSGKSLILGLELGNLDETSREMLQQYMLHQEDLAVQIDVEVSSGIYHDAPKGALMILRQRVGKHRAEAETHRENP